MKNLKLYLFLGYACGFQRGLYLFGDVKFNVAWRRKSSCEKIKVFACK